MKTPNIFVFLAAASLLTASACDLCSVYSANEAHGDLVKGFYSGVAEQFTHFGTMQQDGGKVSNEAGQQMNSSITQLMIGYNVHERFGIQLNLPVIHRSFKRAEDLEIDRDTVSGIGEMSLLGRACLYRNDDNNLTVAWNFLGGVKLPTGESDRLQEEVDEVTAPPLSPGGVESGIHGHDLALGSGSVDYIVGTSLFARYKRAFVSASVQYAIRTKGDFDYRYANDLIWSGGPGVYLVLESEWTLSMQMNVSGEYKPRDTFQGDKAEDTGMKAVYLGPELSVSWQGKLSAEMGVDFSVDIENTALQLVPDYRAHAGVTWRF
jgi:hypothetical protein